MNKQIMEYEGKLLVIHKSIPQSQMTSKQYGFEVDDQNTMVRIWSQWLQDNCKNITKVLLKQQVFLFCEEIEDIAYED